jgi:hypothetical protein
VFEFLSQPYLPRAPGVREYIKPLSVKRHNASLSDACKALDKVRVLPMLMASRPFL